MSTYIHFTEEQKHRLGRQILYLCLFHRAKPSNAQVLNMSGRTAHRRSPLEAICGITNMTVSEVTQLTSSAGSITNLILKQ